MFANMLFLTPIVLALLGVGVLIWTRREEIIWKPCPDCAGQGQVIIHTDDGREADACTACDGEGVVRRLAMFKSCIANVGSILKHSVYFGVLLLSSIVGIFFMYLGSTGSWDAMTIVMSLLGVLGMFGVITYVVAFMEWFQESWDQANHDGLICTDPAGPYYDNRPTTLRAKLEKEIDQTDPQWIYRARFHPRSDLTYVLLSRKGKGHVHPIFKAFCEWNDEKLDEINSQIEKLEWKVKVCRDRGDDASQHTLALLDKMYLVRRGCCNARYDEARFASGKMNPPSRDESWD